MRLSSLEHRPIEFRLDPFDKLGMWQRRKKLPTFVRKIRHCGLGRSVRLDISDTGMIREEKRMERSRYGPQSENGANE